MSGHFWTEILIRLDLDLDSSFICRRMLKQECIPVGCLPPAAVAVGGVSTRHPPGPDPPRAGIPPPEASAPRAGTLRSRAPQSRHPPGPDPPSGAGTTPLWTDTHL